MGSADAFNDGAREQLKVGAGPFLVQKRDAEDGPRVTLVRNPKWWGEPAKLKRIVLRVAARRQAGRGAGRRERRRRRGRPGRRAAGRLRATGGRRRLAQEGRADGNAAPAGQRGPGRRPAETPRPPPRTSAVLRGYTIRKALEPAYTQLALNGSSGPLADERVRRAVARAIDRQALADTVLKPLDLPSEPLGSHLLMAGQHGYADHSDALGGQDAGAAKALLADAGWKSDGADRQQAGEKAGAPAPDGCRRTRTATSGRTTGTPGPVRRRVRGGQAATATPTTATRPAPAASTPVRPAGATGPPPPRPRCPSRARSARRSSSPPCCGRAPRSTSRRPPVRRPTRTATPSPRRTPSTSGTRSGRHRRSAPPS